MVLRESAPRPRHVLRRYLAGAALVILAGCAGSYLPQPDSEDAHFFSLRCGVCHVPPHPKRHTMAEWHHLLELMDVRMEERAMAPLSGGERRRIIDYLERNAR